MGLSRQSRITILLVIDTFFFFLEIIAGYTVNSLALVADSFHMLNDVISLVVALYAVKLATSTSFSSKYSYGWQRAEVLGALINGVFLLALCFSIFIEAIQRFFEPQVIENPTLVFIVGSAGLLSNFIGLLLFHEHGHGHGHGHEHKGHSHDSHPGIQSTETLEPEEILVHPAQTRQYLVEAARTIEDVVSSEDDVESEESDNIPRADGQDVANAEQTVSTPAGNLDTNENLNEISSSIAHRPSYGTLNKTNDSHDKHDHKHKGHAHGSQNLNMQGVFLHVLGDALGNIGVIATALFIKYTDYEWRFYADPLISLIITIIIFSSALPLVRSTSFILLQGVPSGIPIDDVREKILNTSGVLSVHELHIWQLSDTKLIASVHVKILHSYGIHSATIQPEFDLSARGTNASTSNDSDREMIANELDGNESACLLRCAEDETCAKNVCCPTPTSATT
ncbi:5992_t:CDS:2, partial [Ambispora leptoticha]